MITATVSMVKARKYKSPQIIGVRNIGYADALLLGVPSGITQLTVMAVQILQIFGSGDQLYFEFGSRYLRIFMFCIFINGIQILTSNFFPAIGKAKQGILLSLSRQAFLQVPLLLILPYFMGINGVLYAGAISDALAGALAVGMAVWQIKRL